MVVLLLLVVLLSTTYGGYISTPMQQYDYVIVGGGVSGCVVASRLSENPAISVLLLEAGGKTQKSVGGDDWVGRGVTRSDVPYIAYTSFEYSDNYFWPVDVSIGKGLGGGGIVNGMRWVRALEHDFERWNVSGWDFKTMLPYFIKTENNTGASTQNSPFHGYAGPVEVSDPIYTSLESTFFVQSAQAYGLPYIKDFNGDPTSRIGAGYHQYNIRAGIRDSSANAYLAPALNRSNLHVMVMTQATKILFQNKTATGVQFIQNGDLKQPQSVNASKEVILTTGTINTPKLLLLSGVGSKQDLVRFPDIEVVHDLPGVGKHFQDHPMIYFSWDVAHSVDQTMGSYPYWQGQYDLYKNGILATIDRSGVFVNSRQHPTVPSNIPDIQIEVQDDAGYIVYNVQPDSANGTVMLNSSNPLDSPLIDDAVWPQNIEDNDVKSLVWAISLLQKILDQSPMNTLVGKRNTPSPDLSPQQLYDYVHQNVRSGNHLVGTCRMGTAAETEDVVDNQMLVIGLDRLRIADASIIPFITNGNQQANIMAIAERAVDFIKNAGHM